MFFSIAVLRCAEVFELAQARSPNVGATTTSTKFICQKNAAVAVCTSILRQDAHSSRFEANRSKIGNRLNSSELDFNRVIMPIYKQFFRTQANSRRV